MKGDGKRLGMLLVVVGLALSPFAQAQETFTVVQRKQINYAGTGVSGFLSAIVHDGEVYAGTYANASSGGDNYVYSSYDNYDSPVVLAGADWRASQDDVHPFEFLAKDL